MRIGLVQLDIIWENKELNKQKCEEMIQDAFMHGVELIIFPEMTLTGFSMDANKIAETVETSETILFFKKMTRKYNMAIVFGYVERIQNRFYNKLAISKMGKIIGDYSKIHSFSFSGEDKIYTNEYRLLNMQVADINIGAFICYDLRFPEIFQASSKQNDVIIVIANWPKDRAEHWKILLKARAIENQCYIIGVNRVGEGDGLEYEGDSAVIDPMGNRITDELDTEGLIVVDIEKEIVDKYREEFCIKQDRKVEFYRNIL